MTPKLRSVEEVGREEHIHWLGEAKTAQFKDAGEMTVLPYGYLSTAIIETLTQDRQSIATVLIAGLEERREVIRAIYDTQMEERVHRLQEVDTAITLIRTILEAEALPTEDNK